MKTIFYQRINTGGLRYCQIYGKTLVGVLILYLATLSKIDPSYYEAAKIDGATRFQQIMKITLPMLKGIISLNLILTISGLLGSNLDQTMVLMNNQKSSEGGSD